ncbi:unnamed protein product [Rhizophagus irregularis]|nr:unnamed protein product [Rhizophagus irregularis]
MGLLCTEKFRKSENSTPPAMPEITLNCIVRDKPTEVFQVSIDKNAIWFVQVAQNDTRLAQFTYDMRPIGTILGTTPAYEVTQATRSVESHLEYINVDSDEIHVIVYASNPQARAKN